ncbi:MAG: coenzyme F420-0:L-glutamate ligase [Rhodospirillales bacterium]
MALESSQATIFPQANDIRLISLRGIPVIMPGADLAALITAALRLNSTTLQDGDVVAVAQKVVSKAEDRFVDLSVIVPSKRALTLAAVVEKDPRLVEVILGESRRIVRHSKGVLIVVQRLGMVMANAGVDASNVDGGDSRVLLLPQAPDKSAACLRSRLRDMCGVDVGVVITDSPGRAWRRGSVNIAIGVAGLAALVDRRGQGDLFGRPLRSSQIGHADQIAAAAGLIQGQGDEGLPVVVVRGLAVEQPEGQAADLIRDESEDLFL